MGLPAGPPRYWLAVTTSKKHGGPLFAGRFQGLEVLNNCGRVRARHLIIWHRRRRRPPILVSRLCQQPHRFPHCYSRQARDRRRRGNPARHRSDGSKVQPGAGKVFARNNLPPCIMGRVAVAALSDVLNQVSAPRDLAPLAGRRPAPVKAQCHYGRAACSEQTRPYESQLCHIAFGFVASRRGR